MKFSGLTGGPLELNIDGTLSSAKSPQPFPVSKWWRKTDASFGRAPSGWDSYSAYSPRFARNIDGSLYRDSSGQAYMYYCGYDGQYGLAASDMDATGLALTTDLQTFTRFGTAPVLPRDAAGDCVLYSIIHDGTSFHGWFENNANPSPTQGTDHVSILYATSPDGKVWSKQSYALTAPTGQDYYAPCVRKEGDTWFMYLYWHSGTQYRIAKASAPDPTGPWLWFGHLWDDGATDYLSDYFKVGDTYYLLYTSTNNPTEIWYAESTNNSTFTKKSRVLAPGAAWDANGVTGGTFIEDAGVSYLFYHSNAYSSEGIGFAMSLQE